MQQSPYKQQFNDEWSAALIIDQPFGADLLYPEGGSAMLGAAEGCGPAQDRSAPEGCPDRGERQEIRYAWQ